MMRLPLPTPTSAGSLARPHGRAASGGLRAPQLLPLTLLLLALHPAGVLAQDGQCVNDPWATGSDSPTPTPTPPVQPSPRQGSEVEDPWARRAERDVAGAGGEAAAPPAADAGTPDAGSEAVAEEAPADADAPPAEPSVVTVGMYINRIRDVNLREGTYVVDFWMWFRWQNEELNPAQTFELVNGEILSRIDSEVTDDLDHKYTSVRLVARMYHVFDVDHFPYDNHTLNIDIEDVENEAHLQVYRPDVSYSQLDPSVQVAGWDVTLGATSVETHVYNTNYGFLSIGADTHAPFSRFHQHIELRRGDGTPLLKLFWVTFLSVMLGLLALRVHVTDLDARFGLSVGSIFAAMANTYVLGEILPETEAITMAEQMNFLGVGTIFCAVFISIASIRLVYAGREDASRKLDWYAFVGLGLLYIVGNFVVANLHG
ncbi:MAG: hypothetical protein IPG81_12170 [Sandaracinaceae bacterium]|nr:hypothetical protein [Sandaracinaceae bacterium]